MSGVSFDESKYPFSSSTMPKGSSSGGGKSLTNPPENPLKQQQQPTAGDSKSSDKATADDTPTPSLAKPTWLASAVEQLLPSFQELINAQAEKAKRHEEILAKAQEEALKRKADQKAHAANLDLDNKPNTKMLYATIRYFGTEVGITEAKQLFYLNEQPVELLVLGSNPPNIELSIGDFEAGWKFHVREPLASKIETCLQSIRVQCQRNHAAATIRFHDICNHMGSAKYQFVRLLQAEMNTFKATVNTAWVRERQYDVNNRVRKDAFDWFRDQFQRVKII